MFPTSTQKCMCFDACERTDRGTKFGPFRKRINDANTHSTTAIHWWCIECSVVRILRNVNCIYENIHWIARLVFICAVSANISNSNCLTMFGQTESARIYACCIFGRCLCTESFALCKQLGLECVRTFPIQNIFFFNGKKYAVFDKIDKCIGMTKIRTRTKENWMAILEHKDNMENVNSTTNENRMPYSIQYICVQCTQFSYRYIVYVWTDGGVCTIVLQSIVSMPCAMGNNNEERNSTMPRAIIWKVKENWIHAATKNWFVLWSWWVRVRNLKIKTMLTDILRALYLFVVNAGYTHTHTHTCAHCNTAKWKKLHLLDEKYKLCCVYDNLKK